MTVGTVWGRLEALNRGWKATLIGLAFASVVELSVRAGLF